MLAIIDYGVGNLFSLTASLKHLEVETIVTNKKEDIENIRAHINIKKTLLYMNIL